MGGEGPGSGVCFRCRQKTILWHRWQDGTHPDRSQIKGHCLECFRTEPETWLSCRVCRQERQNTPGGPWHLQPGGKWVPLRDAVARHLEELRARQHDDPTFGYRVLRELGWWPPGRQRAEEP